MGCLHCKLNFVYMPSYVCLHGESEPFVSAELCVPALQIQCCKHAELNVPALQMSVCVSAELRVPALYD